ncbi:MAG: hypothetical protein RLY16_2226 [Bacteroidota bacterium]|jgi:hypothetical protein
MKVRSLYALGLVTALLVFASCSKTNEQGKMIPKDAALVITIDGKSLGDKLPWNEIKSNVAFQEMLADSTLPKHMRKILDNPDSSGMDIHKDIVFFLQQDSTSGYVALQGTLKDAAAFKRFNQNLLITDKVREQEGISYMKNGDGCVAWNDKQFMYLANSPGLGKRKYNWENADGETETHVEKKQDMEQICQSLFNLSSSKSLAKEERFSKLMAETGDMHFWMNAEVFSRMMDYPKAMLLFNLEKLYKGSVNTATLSFEKGKIQIVSHNYASPAILDILEKHKGGKINEALIGKLPSDNVQILVTASYKPEALREMMKLFNVDGYLNIAAAKLGFSMDDFVKANKGDFLFAITDVANKKRADSIIYGEYEPNPGESMPDAKIYFATSIGDKDAFNKLINAGNKLGGNLFGGVGEKIAYSSDGNVFVLSNNKAQTDQFIATKGKQPAFLNRLSGEAIGAYVNIQSLMKAAGTDRISDSVSRKVFDLSFNLWEDILMKGGTVTDGASSSVIEINLKDKNVNSLQQLNHYFSDLAAIKKEQDKKQKEEMMALEDLVEPAQTIK